MKSVAEVRARNILRGQTEEVARSVTPATAPSHWLEAAIDGASRALRALRASEQAEYRRLYGAAHEAVDGLYMAHDDVAVDTAASTLERLSRVTSATESTSLWQVAHALRTAKKGPLLARG